MAHKTLIGGTAYEIDGGKTLIDNTAYEIDKGKTLVGGTAYEVGFAPSEATITITCSYTHENAEPYVEVNGERYTVFGGNVTLSVPLGTVITCGVNNISGHAFYNCYMYLNGTSVNADSSKNGVFSHTVNGNATIELKNWGAAIGEVRIEAENVEMVTVTVNQINTDCAEAGIGLEGNTSSGAYEVPVGTEMSAWVCKDGSGSAKVILNGTTVYTTSSSGTYYHTITRNTIVAVDTVNDNGVITITET